MRTLRPLLACALCCAACSSAASGPHALYSADPTSNQNPFPDARLFGDGGLGARPQAYAPFVDPAAVSAGGTTFATYMQSLGTLTATFDGFGNYGAELVPFSEAMAGASLSAAFSYVSLGGTPAAGPAPRVLTVDTPPFAPVEPTLPLAPATPYALVLTDAARSAAGAPLVRSADFEGWASGAGASTLAAVAKALNLDAKHLVFAMVFTTQDARADLTALATWVAQPLPAFPPDAGLKIPSPAITDCHGAPAAEQCPSGLFSADAGTLAPVQPWFVEGLWDGGSPGGGYQQPAADVGTVVAGTMTLKDARDAEAGHFQASVVSNPATGRDVDRAFVLVLPNPQTQPMPASGYPLALVGHGLGERNSLSLTYDHNTGLPVPSSSMCVRYAEFFTSRGYACLGLDAPSHGTRGEELQFFRFDDLTVTRDYFREMAFDQMQALRIAASGLLSQFGPAIDPGNLRYFGISLGGIMGSTFLSVDPRSLGGVLNVPGGGLVHVFESPNIFIDLGLLLQSQVGILFAQSDGTVNPKYAATLPFVTTIAQMVLESADPINYAPALPSQKHLLIQEGLLDQTVPNDTNDDLTAAFGVATLTAASSAAGGTSGRWQFDIRKWGLDPTQVDPHGIFELLPAVRAQAGDYLQKNCTEILAE